DIAQQRLNPPTTGDLNMVEVKVSLETQVGQEIMVVKLHNPTRQALRLSERDVQLQTEIPVPGKPDRQQSIRVRGLSPQLLGDRAPTGEIAIAPGKTGQLTIDWNDWFHSAYWSSREHEIAAEPALTPP